MLTHEKSAPSMHRFGSLALPKLLASKLPITIGSWDLPKLLASKLPHTIGRSVHKLSMNVGSAALFHEVSINVLDF